jgi:hypothetical protein
MGVDEAEGSFLAGRINENAGQNGVLEYVRKIAGMKGVSIVDRSDPLIPRPPDLAEPRRRVDVDDLAAFDANRAGEQLEPVAHHFAIRSSGGRGDFEPDAL